MNLLREQIAQQRKALRNERGSFLGRVSRRKDAQREEKESGEGWNLIRL